MFIDTHIKPILIIGALTVLLSLPAAAEDLAAQKNEIAQNSKQETIALGHHHFLLFSGIKTPFQYAWSIEMLDVESGTPKLLPLYMQEYNAENRVLSISDGVGFAAMSYHFDPASNELNYTARDVDPNVRFSYSYRLVGDTLILTQLATQDIGECSDPSCKGTPPTIIFTAVGQDAKTH